MVNISCYFPPLHNNDALLYFHFVLIPLLVQNHFSTAPFFGAFLLSKIRVYMKNNIGTSIIKPLSYYLEKFRSTNGKKFNNIFQFSHKEYITIDHFSKKLMYVNDNINIIRLSFDIELDKLTFTEYINKKTSFLCQYNRKVYSNISMYLNDEYHFQQSTIEEVLFSTEELKELYYWYNYFTS